MPQSQTTLCGPAASLEAGLPNLRRRIWPLAGGLVGDWSIIAQLVARVPSLAKAVLPLTARVLVLVLVRTVLLTVFVLAVIRVGARYLVRVVFGLIAIRLLLAHDFILNGLRFERTPYFEGLPSSAAISMAMQTYQFHAF